MVALRIEKSSLASEMPNCQGWKRVTASALGRHILLTSDESVIDIDIAANPTKCRGAHKLRGQGLALELALT